MCLVDNEGHMATVGTTLEIVDFAHVADGKIFITNKGRERFKVGSTGLAGQRCIGGGGGMSV